MAETRTSIIGENESVADYYKRIGQFDGDIITPDILQPTTALTPQTYNPGITDVSGLQLTPMQAQAQEEVTDIQGLLNQLSGESATRTGLEQEKDIAGLTKLTSEQATRVKNLQLEAQRLANQYAGVEDVMQVESEGRGRTVGGLAPLTASEQRKVAIQQRNVASQALTAYATFNVAQGNLQVAQDAIDKAVAAKYDPIKEQINIKKQNLELLINSPLATAQEKAQAEAQKAVQEEIERKTAILEAEQKEIYNLGLIAQKNGASSETVSNIFNAKNKQEAVLLAGKALQDPNAKIELQNAVLEGELKKIQIQKEYAELDVFKKYGGLTPSQWLDVKKAEEKEMKESQETFDKAKNDLREIDNTITQVNTILDSSALDTVVGTNIFSRGVGRQKGIISGGIAFLGSIATLGATSGIVDEFTNADSTVALTEQLLSQQFLDKLITVKGQGATFGALTDREGNALRSAANAIAATKIEKDGRVVGYDISEKEFKKQMKIILDSLSIAKEKSTGQLITDDEQQIFDELNELSSFNPEF